MSQPFRKNKRTRLSVPLKINSLPNELVLEILKYIEPNDLVNASRVCRRWRVLALDPTVWQHQSITNTDLKNGLQVLNLAPVLKKVEIMSSLSPETIYEALKKGHKDIKSLIVHFLENCFNVTQISGLLNHFPNLQDLDIQMPSLTSDHEVYNALKMVRQLRFLRLTGAVNNTSELIEALVECKSLTELDLSQCRIVLRDQHLARLFSCGRPWQIVHLVTHFVTEDGYQIIKLCHTLQDLALVKCRNLGQAPLHQLAVLPILHAIAIKENYVLSATALTNFFNKETMNQLLKVDLTVYRADDDVARTIATNCTQLMHLRFAMCLLTDRGVRDIVLNASNLTHLDLEFNNIRGEAFHLIPKYLPNLTYLNLHLCYNVKVNLLDLALTLPNFTIVHPTGFPVSNAFPASDTQAVDQDAASLD